MSVSSGLGHVEITDAYGQVTVQETLTCAHCQKIYPKPGTGDLAGFCHQCFKPVCLKCGALDRCDPFEKKLERIEARDAMLRSMGL